MRFLGLDVGDKTIGMAISDPTYTISQGLYTLRRTKLEDDLNEVIKVCREYEVCKIVTGLPLNMNGTLGFQSEKVKEFCHHLLSKIKIELVYQDERLTTASAIKAMLEADFSRKKRKGLVDKMAAVLILQTYLDSLKKEVLKDGI
ncbi:MAG: Holliday junction resolvase RuvX [Oscillospiraceae bacterium]|nr:Holliday junction resolvase RuvX [Oscillospiraceae bacterium]